MVSLIVVIPLSVTTGSVIAWAFFWIRRNPNIPESQKRISGIYWLFFIVCVLEVLGAMEGVDSVNRYAIAGKIVGYILVFSPCALLISYFRMGAMVARPPSSVLAELCDCVELGDRFDFSFVPVWRGV
jgi:hypothetical protein